MPNLVAIDVSVTDNRIRLRFSDRAVAAAYAAYLRAQDRRPPQQQAIPGYQRLPHFHAATKEVSFTLPDFITWFITCRLPDDEDSVTFTAADADAARAARWASSAVLFEPVPDPTLPRLPFAARSFYDDDDDGGGGGHPVAFSRQLCVRRLWNRTVLLRRLEEGSSCSGSAQGSRPSPPAAVTAAAAAAARQRGGGDSPVRHGGRGDNVKGSGLGGRPRSGANGGGVAGAGAAAAGRVPVQLPLTAPGAGRLQMGDLWW